MKQGLPARGGLLLAIALHATLCAPQFADGHVSFSFELGQTCGVDGRWYSDARAYRGTVIGPLRKSVGREAPDSRISRADRHRAESGVTHSSCGRGLADENLGIREVGRV